MTLGAAAFLIASCEAVIAVIQSFISCGVRVSSLYLRRALRYLFADGAELAAARARDDIPCELAILRGGQHVQLGLFEWDAVPWVVLVAEIPALKRSEKQKKKTNALVCEGVQLRP
jgi:hypothetical protein